jgi:sirohydrochlorin cobaltochelatase
MKATILFSHGSTLCGAGHDLECHAARLRQRCGLVEVGFMNYSSPTFEEALAKLTAAGATEITVAPYFLVPGYFVSVSLPKRIDAVRGDYPSVTFKIAEPLGADSRIADAVIESAMSPLTHIRWREDLGAASNSCRYSDECPLFDTSACPQTYTALEMINSG